MTLAELGEKVTLSHSAIHHFETELRRPTESLVVALAQALDVTPSYFGVPIREEFREEECHFRSEKIPGPAKTRVLAHGTLFGLFVENVALHLKAARLRLPPPSLPSERASGKESVERVAEMCRRTLGLGLDRPILSMVRVLEGRGVVVTRFEASIKAHDAVKIDAFSRLGSKRPVVVLNADKGSTSRARWDMAHELGHLVLHGGLRPGDIEQEKDADFFASAFLLPRTGFLKEFPQQSKLNWDTVFTIKRRWGASAASIVRRAFDLGRIDALEYRRSWKHYMYRHWHKGEPDEPADEPPEMVRNSLKHIATRTGATPRHLAQELGWMPAMLNRIVGEDAAWEEPEIPVDGARVIPFRRTQVGS
ncbi:hypothetical protein D187_008718 [Cystobacter fuscus DSM 2262]|uniref:HTH cro/C1-type domain-containing protein n=1 Tax=Cystobacter fuscus (strain ATCC 25194 / DSM 2262 / NBRC 100088 / M29) TaxID=1242864 RepID=S9PDT1_CYSF2|nr:hypothetical protein D187_008718 [Cystobacter fuscus DSM 2262]